jgi:hypothetical protein
MKSRILATAAVAFAVALPGVADASTGPKRLQVLAAAQTVHLFAHLTGEQVASPSACNQGQPPNGLRGWFLLPTLSFSPGDATFTCRITARRVVLDLGGGIASEDANPESTWTTVNGEVLRFTRGNLERICDDLLRFIPSPAPATVDGSAISGTQVSTRPFPVLIRRSAPLTYWADSVALGHPGLLAATYCGWKTEVALTRGRHVIEVDLSGAFDPPTPTHFRYDITVR